MTHPDAIVFACSGSSFVAEEIKKNYGNKVLSYASTRSEHGEMHILELPENRELRLDKYKLGENVIIEAMLLAKTDGFIHGNSNVVNFVLCKNPELSHFYVHGWRVLDTIKRYIKLRTESF